MKRPAPIAVAIFDTHPEAEEAVLQLERGGFDMSRLSLVGRGCNPAGGDVHGSNAGVPALAQGRYRFWCGLGGRLFKTAFLANPVLGHLVVLGPLASAAAAAGHGIVGGAVTALAHALGALGVSRECVLHYETALEADKYLLVVHGEARLQQLARNLLAGRDGLGPVR
jgi:hypothetical protein